MALRDILKYLPEVRSPTEKRLSFNLKLKWTMIILVSFFIMSNVALYGADPGFLQQFEFKFFSSVEQKYPLLSIIYFLPFK